MAFILFSFWTDFLLCLSFLFALMYFWIRNMQTYWKKKGLEGPEPTFFVGNIGGMFTLKKSVGDSFTDIYEETRMQPYTGVYMGVRPTWVVNDLDLIKRLLIKDFTHFTDHAFQVSFKNEPLAEHLFNLRGERWRSIRNKISPAFTSSRMRQMFGTLDACAKDMMDFMDSCEDQIVDVKDVLAKYTTDVIGSCAFGLECNSFKDPNAEFRTMGKKLFDPPLYRAVGQIFFFFFPKLMEMVNFSLMGKEINDFFYNTVKNTVEYREKNNVVRNDFMHLLIQLKNEGALADDDSGKHCVFFASKPVAGFWKQ